MAEEKKKKTFTERLNDPLFEALGGFNIFDVPTPGETRKRLEKAKQKKKEDDELDKAIEAASYNINLQSEK